MSQLRADFLRVAEVELVYKSQVKPSERMKITSSNDAFKLLYDTWDDGKLELQEQFRVLLLDRKNSCLGVSTIATGGVSECMVDAKILFATALKARASGIILSHNHPSGNKQFSDSDLKLTKKFVEAAKLFDISILDHIVITQDGYASMADEGRLNNLDCPF